MSGCDHTFNFRDSVCAVSGVGISSCEEDMDGHPDNGCPTIDTCSKCGEQLRYERIPLDAVVVRKETLARALVATDLLFDDEIEPLAAAILAALRDVRTEGSGFGEGER